MLDFKVDRFPPHGSYLRVPEMGNAILLMGLAAAFKSKICGTKSISSFLDFSMGFAAQINHKFSIRRQVKNLPIFVMSTSGFEQD